MPRNTARTNLRGVTRRANATNTRGVARQERRRGKTGPPLHNGVGGWEPQTAVSVEVGAGVQIQHVLLLSFRTSSLSSDVQNHVHLHLVLTGLQSSNTS